MLCKKEARLKVLRDKLFHVLVDNRWEKGMGKFANIWNCYRRTLSVNGKTRYNSPFDDFPSDLKDTYAKNKTH